MVPKYWYLLKLLIQPRVYLPRICDFPILGPVLCDIFTMNNLYLNWGGSGYPTKLGTSGISGSKEQSFSNFSFSSLNGEFPINWEIFRESSQAGKHQRDLQSPWVCYRVTKGKGKKKKKISISFIYWAQSIAGHVRLGSHRLIFLEFSFFKITKENKITDQEGKLLCSVL